ncbi:MAG: GHKL domain-containing protein, partial [Clostridia bacterium]|nr:GHKL domain-containing protein [Clostridia bacterium]
LSSFEGFIILSLIPPPYNAFINYILLCIIIHFIFKTNILKTIMCVAIPTVIYALICTLVLNPFVKIANIEYEVGQYIPLYRLSYLLVCYIISVLLILVIKHKNIYIKVFEGLDKKSKTIFLINLFLGIMVLGVQLLLTIYYTNTLPIFISLLSFICLVTYFSTSIYSLTRVNKLYLTNMQLQNAEEYNKTLQILHDNVRGFKHDYDNTVAAIGGYIKTDDMEGLKQYYAQMEEECLKVNRLYMLNPNIINNPGIYSLLTTKYNEAEELNIKMNITVLWDLSKINMKIYDFTKIFGILVDNAIDAAKESEEKIINITFKDDEKNNMQYLKIENSYKEKDVDIDAIFEKGKTSKENHTGLGLWEIRKILKKNNNLNLHTTKDDKYFNQKFEIYN